MLALVGIPLGVTSRKGGKSSAYVVTVLVAFLYYMSYITLLGLAKKGSLPVSSGRLDAGRGLCHRRQHFALAAGETRRQRLGRRGLVPLARVFGSGFFRLYKKVPIRWPAARSMCAVWFAADAD